jgi:hypothetical protein
MQEMLSGFFDTWKGFMLTSPFPAAESEYHLEEKEGGYLLTYKEGNADVAISMSKSLVISELRVSTPTFSGSVKPRFKNTAEGLMLTAYDAAYRSNSGSGNKLLTVQIVNDEFSGQQLPRKLNVSGSSDGVSFIMELLMRDYQVKKR